MVYNVKDFGATGNKSDDATLAIQKTIEAAAIKGGTVYLPPGDYTSGTIHLRSHVSFYVEAGATLFASEDRSRFADQKVKSKEALLFGEDLEDISIEGRGTIDGQEQYFWAADTTERNYNHKIWMEKLGKPQLRTPTPAGFPKLPRTIPISCGWDTAIMCGSPGSRGFTRPVGRSRSSLVRAW